LQNIKHVGEAANFSTLVRRKAAISKSQGFINLKSSLQLLPVGTIAL
jgi:hypothetical protein